MLGSGSSGNSTFIQSGNTRIILDAGFSARELEKRLLRCGIDPSCLTAVIITHEHSDHIRGLNLFSKKYHVNLFSSERSLECSRTSLKKLSSFSCIEDDVPFAIGDIEMRPFSLPHDADETFGFSIRSNGVTVAYATDLGYPSQRVVEEMKGADCLIVEANHDIDMLMNGPYPWFLKERLMGKRGHLSNRAMGDLVELILHEGTRVLILAHLSEVNNSPAAARGQARRAARNAASKDLQIIVSSQRRPTDMIEL